MVTTISHAPMTRMIFNRFLKPVTIYPIRDNNFFSLFIPSLIIGNAAGMIKPETRETLNPI